MAIAADGCRPDLRVLVVDDHRAFAELLSFALSSAPGITCTGTAITVAEAVAAAAAEHPDVVLLDIEIGGEDGLSAIPRIHSVAPDAIVAVLTAHRSARWMVRATQAGAAAFIPKECPLSEVLEVLRAARPGSMLVAPSALEAGRSASDVVRATTTMLTRRERDVLDRLARGMAPKSIARSLDISVNTCRGYLKTLMAKLDAGSQVEAVVTAQRLGLLEVAEDA